MAQKYDFAILLRMFTNDNDDWNNITQNVSKVPTKPTI